MHIEFLSRVLIKGKEKKKKRREEKKGTEKEEKRERKWNECVKNVSLLTFFPFLIHDRVSVVSYRVLFMNTTVN